MIRIFQYAADMSHILAVLLLLFNILDTKSCAGFSRRSQILMAIVFSTRYIGLFFTNISEYDSFMELLFLATSYGTLFLMCCKSGKTHDSKNDTLRIEFLILPAGLLALFINEGFSVIKILWTFSVYLEAVAILPQLVMNWKIGKSIEKTVFYYLLALGPYRALYLLQWAYDYAKSGQYNPILISSALVQTYLFCGFFYVRKPGGSNLTSDDVESRDSNPNL